METLLEKLKWAFAHQAIVEGLPIKAEHTNRLAEIAYRLSNEHNANTVLCKPEGRDAAYEAAVGQRSVGTNAAGWECLDCGKMFKKQEDLYYHYDTKHN